MPTPGGPEGLERDATGVQFVPVQTALHPATPWGLKEIRALAAGTWQDVRDFCRREVVETESGGATDAETATRGDLETIVTDNFWGCSGRRPRNDDGLQIAWQRTLFGTIYTHHKRRVSRMADAIRAGRRVDEWARAALGRELTQDERAFCPARTFDEWDERRAQLIASFHQGKVSAEEYRWSSLLFKIQHGLGAFDRTLAAFTQDRPPEDGDLELIDYSMTTLSHPLLGTHQTDDGAVSFGVLAYPTQEGMDSSVPGTILGPAALEVSLMVEAHFREVGPRFIITCHAPSCGRRFYSARRNAAACPRIKPHRLSPCKTQWDAYAKFLERWGHDPATDWADGRLKSAFLREYVPRGRQPHWQ